MSEIGSRDRDRYELVGCLVKSMFDRLVGRVIADIKALPDNGTNTHHTIRFTRIPRKCPPIPSPPSRLSNHPESGSWTIPPYAEHCFTAIPSLSSLRVADGRGVSTLITGPG